MILVLVKNTTIYLFFYILFLTIAFVWTSHLTCKLPSHDSQHNLTVSLHYLPLWVHTASLFLNQHNQSILPSPPVGLVLVFQAVLEPVQSH